MKMLLTYYLPMFALACIAVSCIYFIYLLTQPFTPPIIIPNPLPIINSPVHYGEPIQTKVHSCMYSAVPVTSSIRYEDSQGRIYYFSSHDSVTKPGCNSSTVNRQPIPSTLPTGKYIIYVTAVFHVNKLKDVTVQYATQWFQLIK